MKFQNGKGTKLRLEKTILRGFGFLLAIYDVKLCILRNGSGPHRLLSGSDGARGDFLVWVEHFCRILRRMGKTADNFGFFLDEEAANLV